MLQRLFLEATTGAMEELTRNTSLMQGVEAKLGAASLAVKDNASRCCPENVVGVESALQAMKSECGSWMLWCFVYGVFRVFFWIFFLWVFFGVFLWAFFLWVFCGIFLWVFFLRVYWDWDSLSGLRRPEGPGGAPRSCHE